MEKRFSKFSIVGRVVSVSVIAEIPFVNFDV